MRGIIRGLDVECILASSVDVAEPNTIGTVHVFTFDFLDCCAKMQMLRH